ncbi:MAG TPA: iron-containing redox enzyme family protein [Acidimicrobiales bacterium]
MPASQVAIAVDRSVEGLRLLDHPYYRQWQEGLLTRGELAEYAEQYRHFERVLPEALEAVASRLPAGPAHDLVAGNVEDERSRPEPHVDLFEAFATAVGSEEDKVATVATQKLVDLYREAAEAGPIEALAVIAAYETQAGDIAATKAASLDQHYGLSAQEARFWAVHSEMEAAHAAWTTEALDRLGAEPLTVSEWSSRSARAWWSFLDERSHQSPLAV